MSKNGKLIVICGIDGSGKSTLEKGLIDYLCQIGITPCVTKQPTDQYRQNKYVRSYLDTGQAEISMEAMALLAAYDRLMNIEKTIVPAIKRGEWVICNRYVYSTYAYFHNRGVKMDYLRNINSYVIKPNHAFLTDLPASIACERVKQRDGDLAKFEERNINYMERVRETLLSVFPSRYSVVDATLSEHVIISQAKEILKNHVK